jgi:hypothetical protein
VKRRTVEKLEELGDKYIAAKIKADAYGTLRSSVGKRIVAICKKYGKRRTKIQQDNKELTVGYDEVTKYAVDADALRSVIGDELMERITTVQVDHDKLAQVLESGDLSTKQYRKAKKCITEEVTYKPYVRRA